ncbi:hypothetical protein AT1219_11181 [Vibrio alginolyticus]
MFLSFSPIARDHIVNANLLWAYASPSDNGLLPSKALVFTVVCAAEDKLTTRPVSPSNGNSSLVSK